jgi:signal transduction histidine kinase
VDKADAGKLLVKLAKKNGAGSFVVLPMQHQSDLFGHLFCGSASSHHYRAEEVEAMRILASMAAAFLEQRRAQAALQAESRRLAATIEHLPIAVEVSSPTGETLESNAAARALRAALGVGPAAPGELFPGLQALELDGQPIAPADLPSERARLGAQPAVHELLLARPDGRRVATLLVAAAPGIIDESGQVGSVVIGCQDVTRLHELAQAKDRFLRVAAHELRTPVTALHATTQLIDLDPEALADASRRESLMARLRRQSARLVKLVQQLLDSVRLDAGELPLQRTDVDLGALCRDVAENAMPAGGPNTVIDCDQPVVGQWDPLRIEQVLTNLLANAAQYSPPGGEVRVFVKREGDRALLSVSDTGIGIPAHQLAQLFTPFFRGANVAARHAGGLGLGLHIAHQIVRRHGGAIHVRSRENAGTTFTVELPLLPE